jgi:hypothetical protein
LTASTEAPQQTIIILTLADSITQRINRITAYTVKSIFKEEQKTMKKYVDILNEIKKTRASITDTAKNEKELDRIAARDAWKNGTEEEREAAKAKYKEAEARYIKELEKNDTAKLKIEVLKDNAAQAFITENIDNICDIWNKYEGKPHGEKTADKIRAELKAATGHYISIRNKWEDACIYVSFAYDSGAPFRDLEFHPIWNGAKQPATDNDNKIVKLNPENFRVYCCGAYVEDVNAHVKAIRKAHKAAQDAEKALENAISTYNALTRGNIQHASTREGVKNWLI